MGVTVTKVPNLPRIDGFISKNSDIYDMVVEFLRDEYSYWEDIDSDSVLNLVLIRLLDGTVENPTAYISKKGDKYSLSTIPPNKLAKEIELTVDGIEDMEKEIEAENTP